MTPVGQESDTCSLGRAIPDFGCRFLLPCSGQAPDPKPTYLPAKPIGEVSLNGQPAGLVEGTDLMWEADGISYVLGGLDLSLDPAIRIAESLE